MRTDRFRRARCIALVATAASVFSLLGGCYRQVEILPTSLYSLDQFNSATERSRQLQSVDNERLAFTGDTPLRIETFTKQNFEARYRRILVVGNNVQLQRSEDSRWVNLRLPEVKRAEVSIYSPGQTGVAAGVPIAVGAVIGAITAGFAALFSGIGR